MKDGVCTLRLIMNVNSLSPLFIFIGIKGVNSNIIESKALWIAIISIILFSSLILLWRVFTAKRKRDKQSIDLTKTTNSKEYLIGYLFSIFMPFYTGTFNTIRDIYGVLFFIAFILFIMMKMKLHFLNIFFLIFGYNIFTVESHHSVILITKRTYLEPNNCCCVYRITNSVYIEL